VESGNGSEREPRQDDGGLPRREVLTIGIAMHASQEYAEAFAKLVTEALEADGIEADVKMHAVVHNA